MNLEDLKGKANDIRVDIVEMVAEAGSGHPGGLLRLSRFCERAISGGVSSTTTRTIPGRRTATVSFFRRDMRLPYDGNACRVRLFPQRGAEDPSQAAQPSSGTSRLPQASRRRGVDGIFGPGPLHCRRHGVRPEARRQRGNRLHADGRRRMPGGPGLGGCHVRIPPQPDNLGRDSRP